MIKINLLGEKRDYTALYVIQGAAFCLVLLAAVGGSFIFHDSVTAQAELLENEKQLLEAQLIKLRQKTKKVEEMEAKRKVLAEKLMTIAKLKAKKQGPVRVLEKLTTAVPERAWLNQISQKGDVIEFSGIALDNQTVSRLMVNLEQVPLFNTVDLVYSRQYMRDGVKLQQFSLSANLANALTLRKKPEAGDGAAAPEANNTTAGADRAGARPPTG